MTLSPAQAEAAYSAMCALNNVSGLLKNATIGDFMVSEANGLVTVCVFDEGSWQTHEVFDNQHEFARAYGLNASPAPAAGRTLRITIGRRFWDDHAERAPYDGPPEPQMPTEVLINSSRVTLEGTPEQFKGLRDDAAFYCDKDGPDQCPPGLKRSAAATLKTLDDALARHRSL